LQTAVEKGDSYAMIILASTFKRDNKYDLAEKYYVMALNKGNNSAHYFLGSIYKANKKWDLAIKHFMESSKLGIDKALYKIDNIFYKINKRESKDNAIKIYDQAIELGIISAPRYLADLYSKYYEQDLAEKYYLMAFENGTLTSVNWVCNIFNNNPVRALLLLKMLNSQTSEMKRLKMKSL